jgi:capsular polysaccharide biosynthesis protein
MEEAPAEASNMLKRWRWVFLGCAVVCPLLGLIVAALATVVVPESFEGSVNIEVFPEDPDDLHVARRPAGVAPEEYVAPWILKEIGSITDRKSLEEVIGKLDLHHRWRTDREGAATVLEKSVAVRSLRGTPVVAIRVRHADQASVGRIARELAANYQDRRLEIEKRAAAEMAGKLRTAIRDQEQKVDECRIALAEIGRTMKKNLNIGGTETLLHIPESPEHAKASRALADAEGLLQVMRIKLIEQDHTGRVADDRFKVPEDSLVSTTRVSPDVAVFLTTGAVLGLLIAPLPAFMAVRLLDRRTTAG